MSTITIGTRVRTLNGQIGLFVRQDNSLTTIYLPDSDRFITVGEVKALKGRPVKAENLPRRVLVRAVSAA